MDVLASKLEEVPFTVQGLANVAWAFGELQSENSELMRNLLQRAVARLSQTDVVDTQVSVKALLSLSHALATWDSLLPEVMEQMEGILRRRAARLDGEADAADLGSLKVMPLAAKDQPRILCTAPDVGLVAIWKPPNWTVSLPDDEEFERPREKSSLGAQPDTGHPLQSWVAEVLGCNYPVCRDPEHQYGLVHRLDRFTSGAVLCATSYAGLYLSHLQRGES